MPETKSIKKLSSIPAWSVFLIHWPARQRAHAAAGRTLPGNLEVAPVGRRPNACKLKLWAEGYGTVGLAARWSLAGPEGPLPPQPLFPVE
jgi:hypothetical protein